MSLDILFQFISILFVAYFVFGVVAFFIISFRTPDGWVVATIAALIIYDVFSSSAP